MSIDLFAGSPVRDFATSLPWYVKLLGEPLMYPNDIEAVWEIGSHRFAYIVEEPEHAGHAVTTLMVDDLEDRMSALADRGITPELEENYDNGVRKTTYLDPDGNRVAFGQVPAETSDADTAHPVVHFEISGEDPERLRRYYGELFGWDFQVPSPVAREVSDPGEYGFVDLVAADDGTGIRGGVGGGPGYPQRALFYVGVPDVAAALDRAESLGGTRVLGPVTSPSGLVIGHFTDPEGILVGVAGVK
jgi:uncharacterized protein